MSVILFQPSVAPFVQQAARALHESGQLARFETTLCDQPHRWSQRFLAGAARLAGRDLGAQFRRRAVPDIPAHLVRPYPWTEYLRLGVGALDPDGRTTDLVWEKAEHAFDRRVAKSLRREFTAVYGFEHSSLATFQRARELGLRVAYDVPAPDSHFTHTLIDRELELFPELRSPYRRHTAARESRRLARRRSEWHAADLIIAASQFTKRSYAQAGLDVSRVRVVPYGSPPPVPRDPLWDVASSAHTAPLTFLWAGTLSIRKGAHYVIEAWRKARLGTHAQLKIFGAVDIPDRLLQPLPEGVVLGGSIPRSSLLEEYRRADALLFPTLCDGFGMVATESWSQGLPVITTDRAGATDLLRDRENGLLIPAGSSSAIEEVVQWCLDHRKDLAAMRESAIATAERWQWSDYRRRLAEELRSAGFFQSRVNPSDS